MNCIFYLGCIFGSGLLAPLADRYGRKNMLVYISYTNIIVFGYCFVAEDFFDYGLILLCSGILCSSFYITSVVYLSEIFVENQVTKYWTILNLALPFSCSIVIYGLSRIWSDWINCIKISCAIWFLIALIHNKINLLESPNFLISRGENYEASEILKSISTINNPRTSINGQNLKKSLLSIEIPTYAIKEFVEFEKLRSKEIFQYKYFCKFKSSRKYMQMFPLLAFFSCFTFTGILRLACSFQFIEFMPILLAISIMASLHFVKFFITRFLISVLLNTIFAISILAALFLLYIPSIHSSATIILYPLAFILTMQTLIFSAVNCPCRVRTTGFGIVCVFAVLGCAAGNIVPQMNDNLIFIFSVSALTGSGIMKWIKKETENYKIDSQIDDIYEICQHKLKYKINVVAKMDLSFYSEGRQSTVKAISMLDCGTELEYMDLENNSAFSPISNLVTQNAELYIAMPIEYTQYPENKLTDYLPDILYIHPDGVISQELSNLYIFEGTIKKTIKLAIRNENVNIVSYNGIREKLEIKGKYYGNENENENEFSIKFAGNIWSGTYKIGDLEKNVDWVMWIDEKTNNLYGFYEESGNFDLVKGKFIDSQGNIESTIIDAERSEIKFNGLLKDNRIRIIHEGNIVIKFDLAKID